jgi:hypothetical protein
LSRLFLEKESLSTAVVSHNTYPAFALAPEFRNRQTPTDLARKQVSYFSVTRHRFNLPGLRVTPQRMSAAFPL